MKNKFLITVVLLSISILSWGQVSNTERIAALEHQISSLQNETWQYKNDLMRQLNALKKDNDSLKIANDSLKNEQANLAQKLSGTETQLNGKIDKANGMIEDNSSSINNRTWGGGAIAVALLLLGALLYWLLGKRLRKSNDGMESIKEAQNALEKANKEIQEKSIELDNKLVELLNTQIQNQPAVPSTDSVKAVDHSLALKVADEIVRIELNLSRMDSGIKGHKQLSKAVERIKNNFLAQGYEIVDMLGKPYNDGMKVVASFVSDESLKDGEQIITGITKPQINYNGEMIQAAQITVSQNI